jgi:hypothetical protein
MQFIRSRSVGRLLTLFILLCSAGIIQSQQPTPRVVTGGMNAEFTIADQESSIGFYHDVLGLGAVSGRTNPALPAVGQLTGTITGAAHVARLPVPGVSWWMEIVETTGVERKPVNARRQDVGATGLILYVRDLDITLAALKKAGAPIVTIGGSPINLGKNDKSRAIVAKDPNGFFIEVRQMDPLPKTTAPETSNVIGAAISVSVENTEKTARYWKDMLDFDVKPEPSFSKDEKQLMLQGTPAAQIRKSIATDSGGNVVFEFLEFKDIDRRSLMPHTQDPGSGAFAVTSSDMGALVKRLKSTGETKILTVGNDALNQGARIAMFFQDLNGFIIEAIQRLNNPAGRN